MSTVIELKDVSKTYPDGERRLAALNHVSLSISAGTFTSVTGRSGSGKTTLLNLIGALDRPTAGKIYFEGEDLSALPDKELSRLRRKRIGFIFQAYNLLEEYNVWDNICLPLYLDNAKPDTAYVEELLHTFGLWERRGASPSCLSGGQQQRVAVARALVTRPAVILADEPTGNLDYKTGLEVMGALKLSKERFKQTVILVTHDMENAAMAQRMLTLEDGKIAGDTGIKDG